MSVAWIFRAIVCSPGNMSQTTERNCDDCSRRIDELDSQVSTVRQPGTIDRCRVCFKETENSIECLGNRYACSGWSDLPVVSWSPPFRDNTNGLDGGCKYQWRVECEWCTLHSSRMQPSRHHDSRPVASNALNSHVSLCGISCRQCWPAPTTLAMTTLLG